MHLLSRAAEINALVQKAWEAKEQADKDTYIKKVTGDGCVSRVHRQPATAAFALTMLLPSHAWGVCLPGPRTSWINGWHFCNHTYSC